ncbi:MAG: helix-turn-helix domain-containing GNAT family N-acetyltransferase [Gemmatimonadota bacterium]|nr:helix-turn-helix domain-containing GNAT family N-acetyltransferase [Gemmatimonadota bacterium]
MSDIPSPAAVDAIRSFNRFYTRHVGALDEHHLGSPLSLGEVRILYEIAHSEPATAGTIADALRIDRGYLSRQIAGLVRLGLISKKRSPTDGRISHLSFTARGKRMFAGLDRAASKDVAATLQELSPTATDRLVDSMRVIRETLGDAASPPRQWRIRTHRAGDVGWVIQRHAELYYKEYRWGPLFEALVAEIAAKFLHDFDARREQCWIAELDGMRVGSVFLVKREKSVAQLRLLLVDPAARGLGIGEALVQECVRFARASGYRSIMLWTNDVLLSARRIYEAAGFTLVEEEEHTSWGPRLVSQTWELSLTNAKPTSRRPRGARQAPPRSPAAR